MLIPLLKDLHIRITSACNLCCAHCYASDWFNDNYELDRDLTKTILQAKELGCEKVTFTGGEPFVATCITKIVEFCLDQGLRVEIETNGVLIKEFLHNVQQRYAKKLEFSISYDGEYFRGTDFASIVRENILSVKNLGCKVKLQTVLTKINRKDMNEIFEFSRENNILNRVFLAHSPTGNGKNIPSFELNEWLNIINVIKRKYPHVIIELPDIFSGGRQKKCGWGVHRCEIMPNGDVTSCGPITFNKRDYIAGNIYKENLKTIWSSNHFNSIRNLRQSDFDEICSKCFLWESCLGACRSIASSNSGFLLSCHPFCSQLLQAITKDEIDRSLIADFELIEKWINLQQSPDRKQDRKYYECVINQHRLTDKNASDEIIKA